MKRALPPPSLPRVSEVLQAPAQPLSPPRAGVSGRGVAAAEAQRLWDSTRVNPGCLGGGVPGRERAPVARGGCGWRRQEAAGQCRDLELSGAECGRGAKEGVGSWRELEWKGMEESRWLLGLSRARLCESALVRKPGPSVPVMALRLAAQTLFVLRTDLYLNCSLRCRGGWKGVTRWRGGGRPRAGLELTGTEPR